jgi:16S rRNA (cytidine1402-2'-O)-methyltransferase
MDSPVVYLSPSTLDPDGIQSIPASIQAAVKNCQVFFTENERTARRYLKQIWREMVIDSYEWYSIHKTEKQAIAIFQQKLREKKNIGIISDAGCPGIADPGQLLVAAAQELNITVIPQTGPNSIILGLMASGLNGQQFRFNGYLPIDNHQRIHALRELELESKKKNCTQAFIETPYRNNQLLDVILKTCLPSTRLCLAVDLTGPNEWIKTKKIVDWKKDKPDLNKRPAIFLLLAES